MIVGCFHDRQKGEFINFEHIEKELPEIFRVDSMKGYKYPKSEYLSLLGITCCAGSCCVDRILLDTILYESELYEYAVEFLCTRYNFYTYEIDN